MRPWGKVFQMCVGTHRHTLTAVFSASASEDVGDKGLSGLSEGELSTLERYSGSGTYKTYKKHFD